MNFLAHFHLAWPDEDLVAGGLEGDYFKGPLNGQLHAGLERGVRLHRAIDAYTDNHPVMVQLRRDLPQHLRRYVGILVDLSFDHYLSLHWSSFSDIPLNDFSTQVYRILQDQGDSLSTDARLMRARMIEYDILNLYLQWETVPATAERIGRRFKRSNPFEQVDRDLTPAKAQLEQAFLAFYPDLLVFSKQQEVLLLQSARKSS
jgi:acyl carrier protein phosphodiesterase